MDSHCTNNIYLQQNMKTSVITIKASAIYDLSKENIEETHSMLNSRLNLSKSRASQASQRSSVRPSKAVVIRIVVQMLSDMIAFCPAIGPRLFRCKLRAVTKCSIASLQAIQCSLCEVYVVQQNLNVKWSV